MAHRLLPCRPEFSLSNSVVLKWERLCRPPPHPHGTRGHVWGHRRLSQQEDFPGIECEEAREVLTPHRARAALILNDQPSGPQGPRAEAEDPRPRHPFPVAGLLPAWVLSLGARPQSCGLGVTQGASVRSASSNGPDRGAFLGRTPSPSAGRLVPPLPRLPVHSPGLPAAA